MHIIDIFFAAGFQINGLPDTARIAVTLLASKTLTSIRVVVDGCDGQTLLRAEAYLVGQFKLERRITALMRRAKQNAVKPSRCMPVAGADNEKNTFALPRFRHGNSSSIPARVVFVGNARQFRAPRKRHLYFQVEPGGVFLAETLFGNLFVESKVPFPVQVQPFDTLEIGAWMFRQRNCSLRICKRHHAKGSN